MNVIPTPQLFKCDSAKVSLQNFTALRVSGLSTDAFELLKCDFPGVQADNDADIFRARMETPGAEFAPVEIEKKPDAYVIRVTPEGIAVDADDCHGLWYGLQTLRQMIEADNSIPVCEIHDHAAIRYRGVHWDMKGYQPKFTVLMDEFRRLSKYKVNLVLLELEDKYQYRNTPGVGVAGAYSFEQLRILSRHAAALGITVVPKLQCLGHVDYILKHSRYRHLREAEHPYQYCPHSDEAFALWKAMAGELMECFSEHREFFHIGADETDNLGECPECSKYSKVDNYIFHVNRCLDFLVEQGRTPVMWEDMLRDQHKHLGIEEAKRAWKLSEKAILNYWAYGYGGKRNTFSFMSGYRKQGARVWGASGFSGCDKFDSSLAPLEFRAKNIDAWTKSAIENDLDAIISTGWTRIASATPPTEPHEVLWFNIIYAAESMWNGTPRDLNDFVKATSLQLYGCILPDSLCGAVMNINRNPFLLREINYEFDNNPPLALLQYLAACESFAGSFNDIVASRRMFQGKIDTGMTDYIVNGRRNVLKKFLTDLNELEEKVRKYLSEFYEPGTVDEYILTRFSYCREYAEDFLHTIDKCKLI